MWLDVLLSTRAAKIQVNRMMSISASPPVFYAPAWVAAQAGEEEGTRVSVSPQFYCKQMFQRKRRCREPVQHWHGHHRCCRRRGGNTRRKGQPVCGVVQVLNVEEIPPELLVSRGDFAPPSPGKSRRLLHRRCRAPGCGADCSSALL